MTTAARPTTRRPILGPADHGRAMTLRQFLRADFQEGWLYELARGILIVTEVPHPEHALIVDRVAELFISYRREHPDVIFLRAGGGECRLRLPGMQSDRHPDQAVYFDPPPEGKNPWVRWVPRIVVEVVSPGSEDRDYVEKREEYLRFGISEYWILDPFRRQMLALRRAGDTWEEVPVAESGSYRTHLLPGLVVRPAELLGPASGRGRRAKRGRQYR